MYLLSGSCSDGVDAVLHLITLFSSLRHVKNSNAEEGEGAKAFSRGKLTTAHLEQASGVIAKR